MFIISGNTFIFFRRLPVNKYMTDLSVICGLPIKLDEESEAIFYDDSVVFEKQINVALSEITPILLNKFLRYPETVYRYYSNVSYRPDQRILSKNASYNVIQIPYGLLGVEFVKTHIYYSEFVHNKYDCIIEVIRGELTVLVQKNSEVDEFDAEFDSATNVEEINIINVTAGEKICIPTGVFYTFVNCTNRNVIFAIVSGKNSKPIDYSILYRERGLAFYIISKNA